MPARRKIPLTVCVAIILGAAPIPAARAEPLSLSEIKTEHIDDVDRRGLGSRECAQWLEQPAVLARLCSRRDGFSLCCNSPRTTEGHGGGAVRQTQRHDQGIPAAPSQSAVPHSHSAMASAV